MQNFRTAANKVGVAEKAAKDEARRDFELIGNTSIEISISCRNLANKDDLSKSDPICVIYHCPPKQTLWHELKKTEMMDNNLNPDFATKLQIDYRFEQAQFLRFQIYDIDSVDDPINEEDTIGFLECTVAEIISAGPQGYTQELEPLDGAEENLKCVGKIILIAEELSASKDEVILEINGTSVGSCLALCLGVKSSYVISRLNDAGNFLVAHRSPEIIGMNPSWPSLTIASRHLCYGDKDRAIKIEIFRKNIRNEDELIGACLTTINRMTDKKDTDLTLRTAEKKDTTTTLSIGSCIVCPIFTFVQFIQAGTQLHLCFAIDFTMSNGDYTKPESLHYISDDGRKKNPYEEAIQATGLIMQHYDDDNIFPVYGFGAKIPPTGKPSHNFPITLKDDPSCQGIEGVVTAYRDCIKRIELFGPTHFAPIINTVMELAEKSMGGTDYYLLVILTDGSIEDLVKTKQAIIKASALPVSIIIIGIGNADFKSMEELDGDDEAQGMISYMGSVAKRDIVQFVEYRSAEAWLEKTGEKTVDTRDMAGIVNTAIKMESGLGDALTQGRLAEEILKEIPTQITGYMKANGIEPSMISKVSEQRQSKTGIGVEEENLIGN